MKRIEMIDKLRDSELWNEMPLGCKFTNNNKNCQIIIKDRVFHILLIMNAIRTKIFSGYFSDCSEISNQKYTCLKIGKQLIKLSGF